jgi:hypothetical protein
MLGLIYPAVLGSILYFAIQSVADQVFSNAPLTATITIKFILLFITTTFYITDYMYITFTNEYRSLFFLYDLGFLITLYLTFIFIDMRHGNIQPMNRAILICYAVFLGLYLLWDRSERDTLEEGKERNLFVKVVRWEKVSLIGIVVAFVVMSIWDYPTFKNLLTVIVLLAITVFFAKYTWEKKEFYQLPEY